MANYISLQKEPVRDRYPHTDHTLYGELYLYAKRTGAGHIPTPTILSMANYISLQKEPVRDRYPHTDHTLYGELYLYAKRTGAG